jgi:hypothetical protein
MLRRLPLTVDVPSGKCGLLGSCASAEPEQGKVIHVPLQVYLDALGVPLTSERRNGLRGIYDRTSFNTGRSDEAIEVLLLDERYERMPLPCHTRARSCRPDAPNGKNRKVRCCS